MSQAVLRLVTFPDIAREITDAERASLDGCEEPGSQLLRDLIDDLRSNPAKHAAQVIERFAQRPGGDALPKLVQRDEHLLVDAVAATSELHGALAALAGRQRERRVMELEELSRSRALDETEKRELQRLMSNKRS